MRDGRRSSCFGRESLARLSIGVSGTKVTGPWSGQSDGYALSHSVHPAGRGRGWKRWNGPRGAISSPPACSSSAPVSTCFNSPVLGAFCSEGCDPCCYSQVGTNTSLFLSNSHQPQGKPALLMSLGCPYRSSDGTEPTLHQNYCKTHVRSSSYIFFS